MAKLSFLVVFALTALCAAPAWSAGCAPDLSGNGTVDVDDALIMFPLYNTADPRADLDGDGTVGDSDVNILTDNFGAACPSCVADLDLDGDVDAADRVLLEAAYGRDCRGDLGRDGDIETADVDILTDNYWGPVPSPSHPAARADLDGDSTVNINDFLLIAPAVGRDCSVDLNRDGRVDTNDLWVLLGAWGNCP